MAMEHVLNTRFELTANLIDIKHLTDDEYTKIQCKLYLSRWKAAMLNT